MRYSEEGNEGGSRALLLFLSLFYARLMPQLLTDWNLLPRVYVFKRDQVSTLMNEECASKFRNIFIKERKFFKLMLRGGKKLRTRTSFLLVSWVGA